MEEAKEKEINEQVEEVKAEAETVAVEENQEDGVAKENEKLKARIDELEKEAANWKSEYMRKMADFENFRKRMDKEKEEFQKYANEKFILKILEVVDNLERAITSSKSANDFESLVKGVEMTLKQFANILETEGVAALEAHGKEFNPYEHHAVMQEETEEHDHNMVMLELQKGYKMKDRVIRPALVKVAKNIKK